MMRRIARRTKRHGDSRGHGVWTVVFVFALVSVAWAADRSWEGDHPASPTDWATTQNWSGGDVPDDDDVAIIDSATSGEPILGTNDTVGELRINSDATGTITLNLDAYDLSVVDTNGGTGNVRIYTGGTLVIANDAASLACEDFQIDSGGTLKMTGASGNVTVGGSWTDNGTYNLGTSTVTFDAAAGTETITAQNASDFYNLTINSGGTIQAATNLDIDNNLVITAGTFDLNGKTVTVDGNLTVNGGTLAVGSGTLIVTGTLDVNATLTVGTGTVDANGTVDATGGTVTVTSTGRIELGGATVTSLGTFSAGSGTVEYDSKSADQTILVSSVTYNHLEIDKNSYTASFSGGTLDVNGNLTVTTGNLTASEVIDLEGTFTMASGAGTFSTGTSTHLFAGNIVWSGGSLTAGSGKISMDGTAQTISGSGSPTLGNVEIKGSSTTDVDGNITVASGYTLSVLSSGELRVADAVILVVDGTFDVDGTLTFETGTTNVVDANGTFDASGGSVTFTSGGRLKLGGAVTSLGTFTRSSGTVEYDGTASQTVRAVTYNNLEIDNGSATATAGGDFTVAGTLTVVSGTFDVATRTVTVTGTSDVDATLKIGSGTLDANGTFDATGGNVTFTGSGILRLGSTVTSLGTFTRSTGKAVYDGTGGGQTVAAVTYYDIEVDNGLQTATAGANFTVKNGLTVTGGTFALGGKTVTVEGTVTNAATIDLSAASGVLVVSGTFTDSSGSIAVGSGLLKFNGGAAAGTLAGETSLDIELAVSGTSVEFTSCTFDTYTLNPGTWFVSETHAGTAADYRFFAGSTMEWDDPGTYTVETNDDVTIVTGTVQVDSTGTNEADTVTVEGTFELLSGSTLKIDESLTVESGGAFVAGGATQPILDDGGTGDGWDFEIKSGGRIDVTGLDLRNPDGSGDTLNSGITIRSGATITSLNNVAFSVGSGSTTRYLRIEVTSGSFTFEGCSFDANCSANVSSASTAIAVEMSGATGAKGASPDGEGNDHNDTDADDDTTNVITWTYFKVWTGSTDTDWDTDGNWSPSGVPTSSDSVRIPVVSNAPTLAAIAGEASCKTLQITDGTLNLSSKTLNVYGNLTVEGGGTLTASTGTIAMRGGGNQTVDSGGDPFNRFTIDKTGGTVTAASSLDVNGNFQLVGGGFDPGTYTHTFAGNWTESTGTTFQPSAGTITFDKGGAQTVTTISGNRFHHVTLSGASTDLQPQNALDINGNFTMGGDTTFTPGSHTHTVGGNWDSSGSNAAFDPSAGTIRLDGATPTIHVLETQDFWNLTIATSGTAAMHGSSKALDVDGAFTISSGGWNPGSLSHTVAGNWDDSGGTFAPTAGTVTLDGSGTTTVKTGSNNNFYHLAISAGTKSTASGSAGLDVNGNFTLSGSATFSPGSLTHEVAGDFDVSAGTFQATAGTIELDGTSGTQTIDLGGSNFFYHLTLDHDGSGVDVDATNTTLDVNGDFTISTGTFNSNTKLTVMTVAGNWDGTGGTFTNTSTTVTFDGSGAQSVLSEGFNIVNINKSAGTITLSGTITVASTLTMGSGSAGTLDLGTATIEVTGAIVVNAGNTFRMQGNCTLKVGTSMSVSGTFKALGVTPMVTRITSNYAWTFNSGATIDISSLNFHYPDANGMTVADGVDIDNLEGIDFQNIATNGKYLRIESFSANYSAVFSGMTFDNSFGGSGKNVSADSNGKSVTITMSGYSGAGGGETYEEELGSPAATITWLVTKTWAGNYDKRRQLTVNAVDAVAASYTVSFTLDTSDTNDFQADCDDLRIVYYDGSSYTEIARVVESPGTSSTVVRFKVQSSIAASGSDANYWMYHDNPDATDPGHDENDVYAFHDGFDDLSNWTDVGTTGAVATGEVALDDCVEGDYLYVNTAAGLRDNTQGFAIVARAKQSNTAKDLYPFGWYVNTTSHARYGVQTQSGQFDIWEWSNGTSNSDVDGNGSPSPTASTYYEYKVTVETDGTFKAYRDGTLYAEGTDTTYTSGRVWLGLDELAGANNSVGTWDWLRIELFTTNEPTVTVGSEASIAGNWSDPFNWSAIGVPDATSDVVIDGGYRNAPNVDAASTVASLTVGENNASVLTFAANLTVDNNIVIHANGTLNGTGSTDTIVVGGDWDRRTGGTWTPGTTTVKITGVPNIIASESWYDLEIDGTVTVGGNQTVSNNLTVSDSKSLDLSSYTHTVGGTVTIAGGATVDVSTATITVTGTTTVQATATLDLDGGTWNADGNITIDGEVDFGTGTLDADGGTFDAGIGTLDFNGASGTLRLASTTISLGTLNAGTGTVVFDGTASQTVPAKTYYNLTAANSAAGGLLLGGSVTVNGTLTVSDELDLNGGALTVENLTNNDVLDFNTAGTLTVKGVYTDNGSIADDAGDVVTITFTSSATGIFVSESIDSIAVNDSSSVECSSCTLPSVSVDSNSWLVSDTHGGTTNAYRFYGTMNWNDPATYDTTSSHNVTVVTGTVTLDADESVASLTLSGGTLDLGTSTLTVNTTATVDAGATLKMNNSCTLRIGTSLTVDGTWTTSGATKPTIMKKSGGSSFAVTVRTGGTVHLQGLVVDAPDASGITVDSGATITDIDNVDFRNGVSGSGKYLRILGTASAAYNFSGMAFDSSTQYNVSVAEGSVTITMTNASGAKGGDPDGEANDDDPGEDQITWEYSVEWTGGASGAETDWSTAANWSGGAVPGPSTVVTIADKTYDPVLTENAEVKSMTITTGTLDLASYTLDVHGDITVNGTLTASTGTVAFRGDANQSVSISNPSSNTFNDLVVNKTAGTVTLSTSIEVNDDLTISAGTLAPGSNTITVAGDWADSAVSGGFVPTAGTVVFDGTGSVTAHADNNFFNLTVSAGTRTAASALDINGAFTLSGGIFAPSTYTHTVAGNWDDSAVDGGFQPTAGTVSFDGPGGVTAHANNRFYNLTIASGTRTAQSALDADNDLTISGGTFASGSYTHTVAGDWNDSGASGAFTPTAGTIQFDGTGSITAHADNNFFNLTVSAGTRTAASVLDIDGVFTLSGGSFAPSTYTHTVAGDWSDSGADGGFVPAAGTIQFDGTGSVTAHANNNFFHVSISSGTRTAASALDVNGNVTVASGTFAPGSYTHTVAGNWDDFSGTFQATAGTIAFDGAGSIKAKSSNNFFHLTISSGARTMDSGSAGADINGNFTLSGGSWAPGSLTHEVAGNWADSAVSAGFAPTAGTITLDGASTQTMAQHADNNFWNLTVNSGGGGIQLDATNNDLDVNNDFTISLGTFNAGTNLDQMTVAGDWDGSGGTFTVGTSTVTFDGAADQMIGAETFYSLAAANTSDSASVEVSLTGDVTANNTFTVSDGRFLLGTGRTMTVKDNVTVSSGATLQIDNTGILTLDDASTPPAVSISGTFKTTGSGAKITSSSVGTNYYSFTVNSGGTIDVASLTFESSNEAGLVIADGGMITDLDNVAFQNLVDQDADNDRIALDIRFTTLSANKTYNFDNCTFDSSCDTNVKIQDNASATLLVNMNQAGGLRAGATYENDTGSGDDEIEWPATITWEGDDATNPTFWDDTDNWDLGRLPASTDLVVIPDLGAGADYPVLNVSGTTTIARLTINNNATFTMDTNGNDLAVTGNVFVAAGGTFTLSDGDLTVGGDFKNSGTFTMSGGTVTLDGNVSQKTDGLQAITFTTLTLANTGDVASTAVTITNAVSGTDVTASTLNVNDGKLTVADGAALDVNGNLTVQTAADSELELLGSAAVNVSGNFTVSAGVFDAQGTSTVVLDGGNQSVNITSPSTNDFQNLTINGTGTDTLASDVTVTNTLTVTGGTLEVSTLTLTVGSSLTVNGAGGVFSMTESGGTLKIGSGGSIAMSAGTIVVADAATTPVWTTSGTEGTNFYGVSWTGGTLDIDALDVRSVNTSGLALGSSVTVTDLDKVTYASFDPSGSPSVLLDVTGQTITLIGHVFPTSWGTQGSDISVRANTSGTVTMGDWHGTWGGEDDDSDNSGTVRWAPEQAHWRWFGDAGASLAATDALAAENTALSDAATDGEKLRLRVRLDEIASAPFSTEDYKLQWSDDSGSSWNDVTTSSSVWRFFTGSGVTLGGQVSGSLQLTGSGESGIYLGDTSSNTESLGSGGLVEFDFAIESWQGTTGATYDFRVSIDGSPIARGSTPGTYPQVAMTSVTQFNFVVDRAYGGSMSRPVPILHSSYKQVYVANGGTDDTLYAVSRTDGSVRYSYSAGGDLGQIIYHWDSATSRYHVFVIQDGYQVLALVDNGSSLTANAAWSTNPKPFGGGASHVLSDLSIIKESTTWYLYFVVTSYENNTNSLYKVFATDGTTAASPWPVTPGTGGAASGFSTSALLGWMGENLYVAGNDDGYIYQVTAGGATVTQGPDMTYPIIRQVMVSKTGGNADVYVTPEGNFVWKLDSTTMATKDWSGGTSEDLGSTTSTAAFTKWNTDYALVGDESPHINRLRSSDGANATNFPVATGGSPSTMPLSWGNYLYFGTDTGRCYAVHLSNGTVPSNWPFVAPGNPEIVGLGIDVVASQIYFTTANGRIYAFDLQ